MHLCSPQKHTHRHGHTHTHTPYIHTYTSKATETFFYQTSSCVAHRAVKLHYCWSSVCSVNFPLIGLKSVGVRRHLKTAWSEREKQNGEREPEKTAAVSVCVCVCFLLCVCEWNASARSRPFFHLSKFCRSVPLDTGVDLPYRLSCFFSDYRSQVEVNAARAPSLHTLHRHMLIFE